MREFIIRFTCPQRRQLLFYFILFLGVIACNDDSQNERDEVDAMQADAGGETDQGVGISDCAPSTVGDAMVGDAMVGDAMVGDAMVGDAMAGEDMVGDAMVGDAMAGEDMAGEDMAGEDMAGEEMAGEEINPASEASPRYDGQYFATFESEGLKTALAHVHIRLGFIEGEVFNRYGERVTLGGFVDEDGMLRIPPLTGNVGSIFNATGRVSPLGIIEGAFTVFGVVDREGSFAGSLDNQPIYQPSSEYDGLYDLSFIRDDQEVAVTSLHIDHGRFTVRVVNSAGSRFDANGFVSEDGTLALLGTEPADVLAEAFIDPDTKQIKGIYSFGRGEDTLMGDILGKEAD
jgi:pentapeptide MXKDX repeat protein